MKYNYYFPEGEIQTIAVIMDKIFAFSPLTIPECARIKQCLGLIIDNIRNLKVLTPEEEFIVEYFVNIFSLTTSAYLDIESDPGLHLSEGGRTSYIAAKKNVRFNIR